MGWHGPQRKGASRERRTVRARDAAEPFELAARAPELAALRQRLTDQEPPPGVILRRIHAAPTQ